MNKTLQSQLYSSHPTLWTSSAHFQHVLSSWIQLMDLQPQLECMRQSRDATFAHTTSWNHLFSACAGHLLNSNLFSCSQASNLRRLQGLPTLFPHFSTAIMEVDLLFLHARTCRIVELKCLWCRCRIQVVLTFLFQDPCREFQLRLCQQDTDSDYTSQ